MVKKVKVEKLKKGVFIHDFNTSWTKHPFLKNQILLSTDKMLQRVLDSGIYELYIDTTKGLDIIDLPDKKEIQKLFQTEFDLVVEQMPKYEKPVTRRAEIHKAKIIKSEATAVVQKLSEDVRSGKDIEVENVNNAISKIVDSISRNKDALRIENPLQPVVRIVYDIKKVVLLNLWVNN